MFTLFWLHYSVLKDLRPSGRSAIVSFLISVCQVLFFAFFPRLFLCFVSLTSSLFGGTLFILQYKKAVVNIFFDISNSFFHFFIFPLNKGVCSTKKQLKTCFYYLILKVLLFNRYSTIRAKHLTNTASSAFFIIITRLNHRSAI